MNKTFIWVVVLIVVLGGGYVLLDRGGFLDEPAPDAPIMATETHGSYEPYSPELLARAEDGKVLIFFYASWCPSCRTLDEDIRRDIDMIPPDVTILYVDYDNSAELKAKYGITVQHSVIQVDAQGNKIADVGSEISLKNLLRNIQ